MKVAMALALVLPIATLIAQYLAAKALNPGPPFVTDYS